MSRRTRLADGIAVVGGGALLASAFLHWVRRGPGHSLRGHDLVDTIVALGDTLPGLSAARLTVLWYLVPASGAATWIVVALRGASSGAALISALVITVVTLATVATFATLTSVASLGPGAWTATTGAALVLTSALVARR